jgi:hypothetical protein
VLREAGLVTTRRRGTTICYSIAAGELAELARQLRAMAATAPSGAELGLASTGHHPAARAARDS